MTGLSSKKISRKAHPTARMCSLFEEKVKQKTCISVDNG